MDRGQWLEAARNAIGFSEMLYGMDSPQHTCWNVHFGFFADAEESEKNFAAIRATDIKLRRKYAMTPFEYNHNLYHRELQAEVIKMRIANSFNSNNRKPRPGNEIQNNDL